MKYSITLFNKWEQPYYYLNDKELCINTNYQSYQTENFKLCMQIVKDFLDVPEGELTLDQIRKDFEDPGIAKLTEEKLTSIQRYYNGRLALYKHVVEDLKMIEIAQDKVEFRYDIPQEYNEFYCYANENDKKDKQLEAYIEIKVEA